MKEIDETNLNEEFSIHFEHQCELMKKRFEAKRINFHKIEKKEDVNSFVNSFILKRNLSKIGFSDGVTLHQCNVYNNVYENFQAPDYAIINPFERTPDGKLTVWNDFSEGERPFLPYDEYTEKISAFYEKMRQALLSDVLIVGANAITLQGEIISVDGTGNRVGGMIFGPKHVIIIVGRNKIYTDLETAMHQVRNVTAPLNYIRHTKKHHNNFNELPCMRGKCFNCSHPSSGCNKFVIMRGEIDFYKDRTHLLVVNENLGI